MLTNTIQNVREAAAAFFGILSDAKTEEFYTDIVTKAPGLDATLKNLDERFPQLNLFSNLRAGWDGSVTLGMAGAIQVKLNLHYFETRYGDLKPTKPFIKATVTSPLRHEDGQQLFFKINFTLHGNCDPEATPNAQQQATLQSVTSFVEAIGKIAAEQKNLPPRGPDAPSGDVYGSIYTGYWM